MGAIVGAGPGGGGIEVGRRVSSLPSGVLLCRVDWMGNTCLEVEECLLEARHLASCVVLLYRAQSAGVTWPKVGRGTKVGRASGSRSDMAVKNGSGCVFLGREI